MSLDRVYVVLSRNNFLCALAYWSVVPLLVVLEKLGCGKKPFDPSEVPIDRAYFHGNIPTDAPCYEEYLEVLRFEGFKKTNGATLLLGDRSDPTCAELIINYPDWAERNELLFAQTLEQFKQLSGFLGGVSKPLSLGDRLYE